MIQWQHSISSMPTPSQHGAARSFTRLRARKAESRLKCKGKSIVREGVCFADMEVAVEAPRFRRDFFNLPLRGSERTRPGRNLPPNAARC